MMLAVMYRENTKEVYMQMQSQLRVGLKDYGWNA
jgi:hypothetical protein